MIDLRITMHEMLAAIGVGDAAGVRLPAAAPRPPATLTDPLASVVCTAPHVRLAVRGHTRDDLFPVLKVVLAARFAVVPPARLTRDLLAPLKNGLGNAYKRGNARDRSKSITVTIDITPHGAVIAVTDEGAGFDVTGTLQRFRSQEQYFQSAGAGFRIFDRSGSVVSYADEGRTFQLCFRVDGPTETGATPPAPAMTHAGTAARRAPAPLPIGPIAAQLPDADLLGRVRDVLAESGSMLATRLLRRVSSPQSLDAGVCIEDLRLFGPTAQDAALRCVVRCRVDAKVVSTVLTGLRFDTPAAARADFAIGRALQAHLDSKEVHIPEPIGCLESDRLVFSAFDPWLELGTYLDQRGEPRLLLRLGERLGACLQTLHHSPAFDTGADAVQEWSAVVEDWEHTGARAVGAVAAVLPERRDDTARLVDALIERAGRMVLPPPLRIHGNFGADTIHYGVDGRFYLTRFDGCRLSHPGLDVGRALADLLILARTANLTSSRPSDRDLYDAFLRSYLMNDTLDWQAEIRLFVVAALLSRVERFTPHPNAGAGAGVLLDLCARAWSE